MNKFYLLIVFLLPSIVGQSKTTTTIPSKKGKAYFYWGWNRTAYSRSNIHFVGDNYDFTLYNVEAKDKPHDFKVTTHLNPGKMTIPQTNYRLGYFLKDDLEISVGVEHMKYVMTPNQHVKINGYIRETEGTYDDDYQHENILLSPDFLKFEHTDGLNYINVELLKHKHLYTYQKWKYQPLVVDAFYGGGLGVLVPKTNTSLVGFERHDDFHLSGYGANIIGGINIGYKNFFARGHWKGGYINMPDIRTTNYKSDKAQQSFFYSHANIVFGYLITLKRKL